MVVVWEQVVVAFSDAIAGQPAHGHSHFSDTKVNMTSRRPCTNTCSGLAMVFEYVCEIAGLEHPFLLSARERGIGNVAGACG